MTSSFAHAPPEQTTAHTPHPEALVAEARRIFALQQANRWAVANGTAKERAAKLARLKEAVVAHRDAVREAMWADFHKPRAEVDLTEIQPLLAELEHARRHVAKWMRPKPAGTPLLLAGTSSEVRYESRGIVLIMAPWNYPFLLLLTPLVAAVAAGNCAVLRPSEKVPRTSAVLASIVRQAFDEREVACLTEPGLELANALLTFPFDHIFFTGSTRIGRRVMAAASEHLATVTLELGGKSPLIVDETVDAEQVAARAVWGKFINAGQTCVAPDYVAVHESKAAAFVAAAKRSVAAFYGESEEARQASPDFPRAIDDAAFARLSALLDEAVAAGARIEIGGRRDAAERYVAPTILTNVTWDSPAMREEIFGPILPVVTYRTLDEVIARVNEKGKPLALYVFTNEPSVVDRVVRNTSSGDVVVNNVVIYLANPNLPFGGVGESGQGSYHGWYGFRAFSHERSVLRQGRVNMVKMFYPPYGPKLHRLVDLVGRLHG